MPAEQFGFIKNYSTVYQISRVTEHILHDVLDDLLESVLQEHFQ